MQIGKISVGGGLALALAPMAGYTDAAFRECMALRGADLAYTELASATALARGQGHKTQTIIAVSEHGTTGIQLFTSDLADMAKTAKALSEKILTGECKAKFLDINFGCPAPKVMRTGAGSALLSSPKKCAEVASAAVNASVVPITAKMRTGVKENSAVAIASALESSGVSAITVHGRTAAQKFSGQADWGTIKQVVGAVSVPVIGNGDVHSAEDALRMQETTGCHGVMAGRAALSNPLIFTQVRELQQNGKYAQTTFEDRAKFLSDYFSLAEKFGMPFGGQKAVALEMCSGIRGASRLREKISKTHGVAEISACLHSLSSDMNM